MLLALIIAGALAASLGICFYSGGFDCLAWIWILPVCFIGGLILLALLAFAFLWLCCALVDMDKPQKKDSKFFRALIHLYADAIITVGRIHIHAQGTEKVPKDGRFLLVCNHTHDAEFQKLNDQFFHAVALCCRAKSSANCSGMALL